MMSERAIEIVKHINSMIQGTLAVYFYDFEIGYDDDCIDEVNTQLTNQGYFVIIDKDPIHQFDTKVHKLKTYRRITVSVSKSITRL